jgi:hypothetical protein
MPVKTKPSDKSQQKILQAAFQTLDDARLLLDLAVENGDHARRQQIMKIIQDLTSLIDSFS